MAGANEQATDSLIAAMMAIEGSEDGGFQVTPLTSSARASTDVNKAPFPLSNAAPLLSAGCVDCGDASENWVCLNCRQCYCSRYKNGHAVAHQEANPNCKIHLSLSDMSIWDHEQDAYLDVFALPALQESFTALHEAKFGEPAKFPTLTLEFGDDGGGKVAPK